MLLGLVDQPIAKLTPWRGCFGRAQTFGGTIVLIVKGERTAIILLSSFGLLCLYCVSLDASLHLDQVLPFLFYFLITK